MNYGLLYTIPFAALDNTPCVVEIEREGYEGISLELTGGVSPFTVDIDDEEFLYTPTRFSTAKLSVVGRDYLQDLFSTDYRQHRVTFKRGGQVSWCGFVKPEMYTQDYSSEVFTLEVECLSAMSVLEYLDYTTEGEEKQFVSLWRLLQRCVEASLGRYTAVYIPYVYAKTAEDYAAGKVNVLDEMVVSEQNFFDEEGKPMKLKEVLEEVCKLLGWTCADWMGALYFVDIDHGGTYHRYDTGMGEKEDTTPVALEVQSIGYMGSGNKKDILPGYNKVTVKCSNYPVGKLLDFSVDYEKLDTLQALEDIVEGNNVSHRLLLDPSELEMFQYEGTLSEPVEDIHSYKDRADELRGAIPMRYCNYEMRREGEGYVPDISEYEYTNVIRIRLKDFNSVDTGGYKPVIQVTAPPVAYPNGVFCIDASVKYFSNKELSPISKDKWEGNLMVGIKLWVGENDFTTDEECLGSQPARCSYMSFGPYDGNTEYKPANNDKILSMPYPGAKGKIIVPVYSGRGILAGKFTFWLLASMYPYVTEKCGIFLQDFSVKFIPQEGLCNENSEDRIYENVINEDYINELDEIELKISSYNNDGACYSKLLYRGNVSWIFDEYVTDNLYNSILGKQKRPEEMLITRIINHYCATHIKLTQEIRNDEALSPITRLSDRYQPEKLFINAGGNIDYRMNRFECIMIEI